MMIKLTWFQNKLEFWMRAEDVLAIEKNPGNFLETVIVTPFSLDKGPVRYGVLEGIDEVAGLVNSALGGTPRFKM